MVLNSKNTAVIIRYQQARWSLFRDQTNSWRDSSCVPSQECQAVSGGSLYRLDLFRSDHCREFRKWEDPGKCREAPQDDYSAGKMSMEENSNWNCFRVMRMCMSEAGRYYYEFTRVYLLASLREEREMQTRLSLN